MAKSEREISSALVDELRKLAEWAGSNVKSSDDLIGDQRFRRRWSNFGVENTLAATDLWQTAVEDQRAAQVDVDEANAELRRVRLLNSRGMSPSIDDLDAFPLLRNQIAGAKSRSILAENQLGEARGRAETELEAGRERLSTLESQISARRREIENLEEVLEADRQELASLRADVAKLAAARESLQQLVTVVAEQVGR